MNVEDVARRIWVVISNLIMIYLVWPRNTGVDQLNRAIGNAQNTPLLSAVSLHPWQAIAVILLVVGIVTEIVRSPVAASVNVGYYVTALGLALWGIAKDWRDVPWEHVYLGIMLYTIPVAAITLINAYFYRKSWWRRSNSRAM